MKKEILKIANAQAFWGDRSTAAAEILSQVDDLDVLTLDYLSEVSLSILAIQQEKDPSLGYAKDFLDVVTSLVPFWKKNRQFILICNAGGLNPLGCAEACLKILKNHDCSHLKIGTVSGDNVLTTLVKSDKNQFPHSDNNTSLSTIKEKLTTANAYLGSDSLLEALNLGAQIIITGRIADPCLVAAPCIHHFGWNLKDYDRIAGATIAGHLIECGTQVTGGFSTHWLEYPQMAKVGYPIVEVNESGSFVITKPPQSGGAITLETVKEQLVYEIGDPHTYLSPDVTASFLNLTLTSNGQDRLLIEGAKGRAPPPDYKVSATYRDGYCVEGFLTLFGRNNREKALRCGQIILERLRSLGYSLKEFRVECLGTGDVVPSFPKKKTPETVLRICAKDNNKQALEALTKEIAPLVTSGPQGITGYTSGRPKVRPIFSFWPTLIPRRLVKTHTKIFEVSK